MGTWLQLGCVTVVIAAGLVAGLWLATGPVLSALRFKDSIATQGGTFATWSIIRVVPMNLFVVINNGLQVVSVACNWTGNRCIALNFHRLMAAVVAWCRASALCILAWWCAAVSWASTRC